jgi:hypothetical protein
VRLKRLASSIIRRLIKRRRGPLSLMLSRCRLLLVRGSYSRKNALIRSTNKKGMGSGRGTPHWHIR